MVLLGQAHDGGKIEGVAQRMRDSHRARARRDGGFQAVDPNIGGGPRDGQMRGSDGEARGQQFLAAQRIAPRGEPHIHRAVEESDKIIGGDNLSTRRKIRFTRNEGAFALVFKPIARRIGNGQAVRGDVFQKRGMGSSHKRRKILWVMIQRYMEEPA